MTASRPPEPGGPSRRTRRLVYLSPLAALLLAVALTAAAPPCEDLLDGPCEVNLVTLLAFVVTFVVIPIAVGAALLTAALARRERRRGRRG